MSNRRQKLRKAAAKSPPPLYEGFQAAAMEEAYLNTPLKLGSFDVPAFKGASFAFGARIDEYPPRETIPEVDRKFHDIVTAIFFKGGRLEDHGLRFKEGVPVRRAMAAIRAWLASFEPKHEHKTETVAWALSEWCEPSEAVI